jgi:hypothetical protein
MKEPVLVACHSVEVGEPALTHPEAHRARSDPQPVVQHLEARVVAAQARGVVRSDLLRSVLVASDEAHLGAGHPFVNWSFQT